ncbi:hypothetical protein BZG36_02063 [Bifiguratus adelaidae]|uniref:Nudix hydrolase domain-containing protein n=1 Tax=Bifiguratus adelaidae TaxID=1938954 RepID=A0A261Y1Z0_9FUNG|nr:hypothetical protein BZG36_02063 [Bifiguratus adelaidae]
MVEKARLFITLYCTAGHPTQQAMRRVHATTSALGCKRMFTSPSTPHDAHLERNPFRGMTWNGVTLSALKRGLTRLPPIDIPYAVEADRLKSAAVLVPLCTVNAKPSVLFTVRSSGLRTHQGEVSFPGGKYDEADGELLITALRETIEEIDLPDDRHNIDVIGQHPTLPNRTGLLRVSPFIGHLQQPIEIESIRYSKDEVSKVFSLDLEHLGNPSNVTWRRFRESKYLYPIWKTPEDVEQDLWGLSAFILDGNAGMFQQLRDIFPSSALKDLALPKRTNRQDGDNGKRLSDIRADLKQVNSLLRTSIKIPGQQQEQGSIDVNVPALSAQAQKVREQRQDILQNNERNTAAANAIDALLSRVFERCQEDLTGISDLHTESQHLTSIKTQLESFERKAEKLMDSLVALEATIDETFAQQHKSEFDRWKEQQDRQVQQFKEKEERKFKQFAQNLDIIYSKHVKMEEQQRQQQLQAQIEADMASYKKRQLSGDLPPTALTTPNEPSISLEQVDLEVDATANDELDDFLGSD